MGIKGYTIASGRLMPSSETLAALQGTSTTQFERWFDIDDLPAADLQAFLQPLGLHPIQLARCLDVLNEPEVAAYGDSVLLEYPAAFNPQLQQPAYLTILLQQHILVTIRRGPMPALDKLIAELTGESPAPVMHLAQVIYLIMDEFTDLNVKAQIETRDQILALARQMAEKPQAVNLNDLSQLRFRVSNLVALIEDQLYCITGLDASDHPTLQDPHRKAFIQDLISETEVAQRGIYRLEARVNDLYNDFQAAGSDRVERRLRWLTIISAITLPLGLVAGLLGMNVGGVPGLENPNGFWIVLGLMGIISLLEYAFFKWRGWFD